MVWPCAPVVRSSSSTAGFHALGIDSTWQAAISRRWLPGNITRIRPRPRSRSAPAGRKCGSDGARGVEVAGAGGGVERRTGTVFRQRGEPLLGLVVFPSTPVAVSPGKSGHIRATLAGPLANSGGALAVARFEFGQPLSQPASVKLSDGERSMQQPVQPGGRPAKPRSCARPRPGGIHNPEEGLVVRHASRITQARARHVTIVFLQAYRCARSPSSNRFGLSGEGRSTGWPNAPSWFRSR